MPDANHGASVVAAGLVRALRAQPVRHALTTALDAVVAQPELSSLYPLLDLAITARLCAVTDEAWTQRLVAYSDALATQAHESEEAAATLIVAATPAQLVLLSHSGTVCGVLTRLAERGFLVPILCAESRPRLEGRETAIAARRLGFPVAVCTDAAVRAWLREGAMALLGCDRLDRHAFRNKVGSWAIASAVRDRRGLVVVVTTADKVVDPRVPWPRARPEEPREVWDVAPEGVDAVNAYFEDVALDPATVVCLGQRCFLGPSWAESCVPPTYHPLTVRLVAAALLGEAARADAAELVT